MTSGRLGQMRRAAGAHGRRLGLAADLQGDAVVVSTMLEAELLAHLDAQIDSARRLLGSSSRRARRSASATPRRVLARLADIQTEMGRRGALEQERTGLLQRAGAALGVPRHRRHARAPVRARHARRGRTPRRERSAELRGLLAEIAREHGINRALMRQELAFLVHLTRLIGAASPRPATARAGAEPARPGAARPSTGPGPPGLTMPISSFFGLQTSLRGLLAQQRLLDTTGHNIANASPPATRARRPCWRLAGADQVIAGSVNADGPPRLRRRRRRLPPRPRPVPGPPVPRARTRSLGEQEAAADALDRPSSRSPSRATTASTRS